MRSSPNKAAVAVPAGTEAAGLAPEMLDIRQKSPIKRLLPQTMFGRSVLLIVIPLVLVQIIATWVFYGRHWEIVKRARKNRGMSPHVRCVVWQNKPNSGRSRGQQSGCDTRGNDSSVLQVPRKGHATAGSSNSTRLPER